MADMSQLPHHIQHIKPMVHTVVTGVPMLYTVISSLATMALGFGLGWYIRGRGLSGVQIDLVNIKNDVANLKAKISAPSPVVA